MLHPAWHVRFLYYLRVHGSVTLAAESAQVPLSTAYSARRRSAEFREKWQLALAAHDELRRQAAAGELARRG